MQNLLIRSDCKEAIQNLIMIKYPLMMISKYLIRNKTREDAGADLEASLASKSKKASSNVIKRRHSDVDLTEIYKKPFKCTEIKNLLDRHELLRNNMKKQIKII